MYRMTLYLYRAPSDESGYSHYPELVNQLFRTEEDAQHWFNQRWEQKGKIGYWDHHYFTLKPIEVYAR
jgi:hypothetical protein